MNLMNYTGPQEIDIFVVTEHSISNFIWFVQKLLLFFSRYWRLNSGPCTCLASSLPLNYIASPFYFIWDRVSLSSGWPPTGDPSAPASQVAGPPRHGPPCLAGLFHLINQIKSKGFLGYFTLLLWSFNDLSDTIFVAFLPLPVALLVPPIKCTRCKSLSPGTAGGPEVSEVPTVTDSNIIPDCL